MPITEPPPQSPVRAPTRIGMVHGQRWLHTAVLTLCLVPGLCPAAEVLPWFDVQRMPSPVAGRLAHYRHLACGPVPVGGLPLALPDDAHLVFLSCHGGPYPCPGREPVLGRYEQQFTCPSAPGGSQIATMHLVTTLALPALESFYRERLGDGFLMLDDGDAPDITFIEPAAGTIERPWSPKRLHLGLSSARGAISDAGYRSQIRITLSLTPPNEPRPAVRCRRSTGRYTPDTDPGRPQRYRSRGDDHIRLYDSGCAP